MTRRYGCGFLAAVVAIVVGSSMRLPVLAVFAPSATPQPPNTAKQEMRVTLVGTGGGPGVNLERFGISTLVDAGSTRLLFDCGRASTVRMAQMGIPLNSVSKLFVTHLHSDHVIGIPDLYLTPWAATGRKAPFEVWGPEGTTAMMNGMQQAFAFDIHIRRDVDEKFAGDGIRVESHDVREGVVFNQSGVRVTAFLVDHGPVAPAYGYRVDYNGRSVALSGDTTRSANLMRVAKGVDVLVHEAIDAEAFRASAASRNQTREQVESIIAHHTTQDQVVEVLAAVQPRLVVFSHAPGTEAFMSHVRSRYAGRVESGDDMMTIDVGDDVTVHRFIR
jgi:ribonuclease Z